MDRILTLTDFTEVSNYGVQAAFKYASREKTELVIYHQITDDELLSIPLGGEANITISDNQKTYKYQELLDSWSQLADELQVKAKFLTGSHSIVDDMPKIVDSQKIDLIIIGSTNEYERLDSKWLTHAQSIVKEVDCPVLTIKQPLKDLDFKEIVYASSFDYKDLEVYKYFLEFFNLDEDVTLHLLAINTTSSFSQPTIIMKEAMQGFEEISSPYKVQSHFYSAISVDAGIRQFIDENGADLLVMGNKYEKPLKRFFSGNHTVWNISRAECPVLTIDFNTKKAKVPSKSN